MSRVLCERKRLQYRNRRPTVTSDGVKFVTPDAPDYAATREVYNAGITTQPKIIACCISETGVQRAIERAKADNWPVAVKAGGHSFEGFCLNDDGLVVSVSPMREMQLDPKTGILTAGAGCRLEEVNKFLLAKGRFLPAGSCRTVGLAGLTLGGGYGMFARKWGLTCDHLRRIKMVDGAGIIHDSNEEPDLLWSSRGGGNGHFGIVTELTFNTRPAPAQFSSWKFRAYKLDPKRATALLEAWFEATPDLPNECVLSLDHERQPGHGGCHHHRFARAKRAGGFPSPARWPNE